jgi:tetratricopeptide (TPR) repeat protein
MGVFMMCGHFGEKTVRLTANHPASWRCYPVWLSGLSLFLLILLILALPFNAALAQDAGQIVSVLGTAEVFRDGRWQALTTGAAITAGEMVRTGEGGRAAIQLSNGAQIKLNANSRLEFKQIAPPVEAGFLSTSTQVLQNLLRILSCEMWVRSGGEPLEIETVYATATVRGTEFNLAVEPGDLARLTVLTGLIEFRNPQGSVLVAANEQATAQLGEAPRKTVLLNPLDAVQWSLYYPDVVGDPKADQQQAKPQTARAWTQRAQQELLQGQVEAARQAIDRALALDPNNADAYSLRSAIALVQNRPVQALEDAQRAVTVNPASSTAYLSLSLAHQAGFDLNAALVAAQKAVELDPANPRALVQESSLLFGMGRRREATQVAELARQRAPNDAMVNTVWGFLELARNRIDDARAAFQTAITQDSTLGLPHLGLGLALFRRNQTGAAVDEIRKATLLEPQVSLYSSYLGKAFYEIKDDRRAEKYLELAKQLDPRDPTPWLYDAVRLQSINRPGDALNSVQHSIDLNQNRTVYRSQLLLDEDLSTRQASQAGIYENLGFEKLAQEKATQSLSLDPTNYSAHRFLSDSYAGRPRYEIAQVSELLQAQLLQPININPIQPSLVATNLNILARTGVSKMAFNEYMSLFERDRTQLYASGVAGNNGAWGDEVVVSGLNGSFSYSLGQFHYQTDGFRPNSDFQHDLYDLFVQVEVTPELNLQAEYRRRESNEGDLHLNFDGSFAPQDRINTTQETTRVGARYSPSPKTSIIASLIYADRSDLAGFFVENNDFSFSVQAESQQAEAQWLYKEDRFNTIAGFGIYRTQNNLSQPCCGLFIDYPSQQNTGYGYANIQFSPNMTGILGLGYDSYELQNFSVNQLNPKLGLRWNITDQLVLRAAAFEVIKRDLLVNQTIEPTQIAGFNQFFDDANGTSSKNYGIGLDAHLNFTLFGGLEFLRRDLEMPFGIGGPFEIEKDQEDLYRAYGYWLLDRNWSLTAEYQYEGFKMLNGQYRRISLPTQLETTTVPLNLRYFNPTGFFAGVGTTYVDQQITYDPEANPSMASGSDHFFLFDATMGYRLPKRWGIVALEVRNLTNQQFQFQDYWFQTASNNTDPRFLPERTWLARFILNF